MGTELDYIFHPRSVAVVGAASNPEKGPPTDFFAIMRGSHFKGPLFPVNNRATEVQGVRAFPTLDDVPGPVDYVISSIPAGAVPGLVDQCSRKGVKVLHLYTARMSETGHEDGVKLEEEILRKARAVGIRLIGPNCLGVYYPREGLTFGRGFPKESGPVAFLSQSGGNASHVVTSSPMRGVRFSKVISYGNATDLNEADFMDYLADDPETKIIAAYVEGVREGHRFFEILRRTTKQKPVILLKGGRTGAGTKAVSSHTASLAGSQIVWDAMSRQAGAISVSTMEELIDMMVAFLFLKPTRGVQAAIGGGGGGMSVLSSDECEEAGLKVIPLPADLREQLRARDPVYWDWVSNPVDGSILGGSPLTTGVILELMMEHPAFDMLIANVNVGLMNRPRTSNDSQQAIEALINLSQDTPKPVAAVLGEEIPDEGESHRAKVDVRRKFVQAGIATFPTMGRAARAIRRFVDYHN